MTDYYNQVLNSGRDFYIRGRELDDEGATQIAKALMDPTSKVENLLLLENNIGCEGATAIAKAVAMNSKLRCVALVDNKIGKDGAMAIVNALKLNSTLQTLDLACNRIGDEGAAAIAKAMVEINTRYNATLQALWNLLSHQTTGVYTAKVMAQAWKESLKHSSALEILNIRNNQIGNAGATAFAEVLKINSTLQQLILAQNSDIGDETASAIAQALKTNSTLEAIWLPRNTISQALHDRIGGLLTRESRKKRQLELEKGIL